MSTSSYTQKTQLYRQNEDNAMQRMNTLLSEQNAQLSRWSSVAKNIIREVCSLPDEDLEDDVTSEDLAMVLDYLRLMRSSILMYQDLNEALRNRVDELLEISAQDGQCLGNIVDHFHTMPVMDIYGASRDNQTNKVILNVQFNGEASSNVRSFRVTEPLMLLEQDLAEHELTDHQQALQQQQQHLLHEQVDQEQEQEHEHEHEKEVVIASTSAASAASQGEQQNSSWLERGLSFLLCASVAAIVAKRRFFTSNRRHHRS